MPTAEATRANEAAPQVRWLEVTSDVWMCNGLYLTDADVEMVRRAAADDWRDNTGHECTPADFIVNELGKE